MSDDPPTTRLPRVGTAPPIWPTVDPDTPLPPEVPVIPESVWRLAWAAAERFGPLVRRR